MKKIKKIPLSVPCVGRAEAAAAARAVLDGRMVGRGDDGLALERRMARDLGVKHVLLTTSGSHALELATAVLGLGPGDEVILPSFTFSSVANAVLRQGAKPIFAEVTLPNLSLDVADVERRITKKTKAVIAVHYAGVAQDLGALLSLCRRKRLKLIEDAAHSVGARWKGKALGTLGAAGCVSFHATKNITCGEGGAFLTNSDALAAKAELFREKGTNRSAFLRGEVDKYTWVSEGSSYVLSDVLTAILAEQWKRLPEINGKRRALFELYLKKLAPLQAAGLFLLPRIPKGDLSSYHLFHILLPTRKARVALTAHLRAAGIGAAFHYQPLHASPFARKVLGWKKALPVSEKVGDGLLRLPLYPDLSKADVSRICAEVAHALGAA